VTGGICKTCKRIADTFERARGRMGSATTSQQFIRQVGAALGVSAFVLAATAGGFRVGLLLIIAVDAGALPASGPCLRTACTTRTMLMGSNE
jgi:hypothetical protein